MSDIDTGTELDTIPTNKKNGRYDTEKPKRTIDTIPIKQKKKRIDAISILFISLRSFHPAASALKSTGTPGD